MALWRERASQKGRFWDSGEKEDETRGPCGSFISRSPRSSGEETFSFSHTDISRAEENRVSLRAKRSNLGFRNGLQFCEQRLLRFARNDTQGGLLHQLWVFGSTGRCRGRASCGKRICNTWTCLSQAPGPSSFFIVHGFAGTATSRPQEGQAIEGLRKTGGIFMRVPHWHWANR